MLNGEMAPQLHPDNAPSYEFQLQFALSAEALSEMRTARDLWQLSMRVDDILSKATDAYRVLKLRGWRILAVRFEGEISVTLAKVGPTNRVLRDLAHLPGAVLDLIGGPVHLCATVGEGILELVLINGSLRPLSVADTDFRT